MHRLSGCTLSNKDRVYLCVSSRRRGVDPHKRSKKLTSLDDTPRIIHLVILKLTSAHTHCCVQNKYLKMRTTFVVGSRLVSGMAQSQFFRGGEITYPAQHWEFTLLRAMRIAQHSYCKCDAPLFYLYYNAAFVRSASSDPDGFA